MDSPFAVLDLARDADEEEIKRAYRERVIDAHPDHGGSVREFQRVRTAYEQLIAEVQDADGAPERDAVSDGVPDRDGSRAQADPAVYSRITYLNYDVLGDFGWGIADEDLFEKAAAADLDGADYGQFQAQPGESLLEAAENYGLAWPFACRGGACANCAILLREGELSMPVNHVLPSEMLARDIRLTCNGIPITDELKVVYNVKHLPALEDLLLPPRPFKQAYSGD